MSHIKAGQLNGFYTPDYDGASVVNLMSSIIGAMGGISPHRELSVVPASDLESAEKIVYLIVDGIGEAQLEEFLESGEGGCFFAAHSHRTISTVFPATTAAAVTTFGTGASPAEHGVLGWHLNLPDLGMVATILPAVTRTGVPMVSPLDSSESAWAETQNIGIFPAAWSSYVLCVLAKL